MTSEAARENWRYRARLCIRREIWLKGIGTTVFITLFFFAYFWLLRRPVESVFIVPLTAVDRWIPFNPWALIPYVTLWLYVSLPPLFLPTRRALVIYGLHAAAMCLTGLACFYFWPTAVPAGQVDWSLYPGFGFLAKLDAAGNACPSLHVASAAFTAIWLQRLLRDLDAPPVWRVINVMWCFAIVWSTLATRQHALIDVLAGLALAALVGVMPWGRSGIRAVPVESRNDVRQESSTTVAVTH